MRGGECGSHNLQQARRYCKINVQWRDVDYLEGFHFVIMSLNTLYFLLHATLANRFTLVKHL